MSQSVHLSITIQVYIILTSAQLLDCREFVRANKAAGPKGHIDGDGNE
jgi:hypothetical protein